MVKVRASTGGLAPKSECVDFQAELTRDLHQELTQQWVMFAGQAWVKA
jgi:hypothetical protein